MRATPAASPRSAPLQPTTTDLHASMSLKPCSAASATPCFPSYPSAHASASYAARTVLEKIYGFRPVSVTLSTPSLPEIALHYVRLEQVTDDIDDARVYGGIHFRFDQRAGAVQGHRVGRYVVAHNLRRVYDAPTHLACEPDESFRTCFLRAIRHSQLRRALAHRR